MLAARLITHETANKEAFDALVTEYSIKELGYQSDCSYLLIVEVLEKGTELKLSEFPAHACADLTELCTILSLKEMKSIAEIRESMEQKDKLIYVMLLIVSRLLLTLPEKERLILMPCLDHTFRPNYGPLITISTEGTLSICRQMPSLIVKLIASKSFGNNFMNGLIDLVKEKDEARFFYKLVKGDIYLLKGLSQLLDL